MILYFLAKNKRYYPMRGFGNFPSVSRLCRAFDEVRQFFRVRSIMKHNVSLVQQREIFRQRVEALKALVLVIFENTGPIFMIEG